MSRRPDARALVGALQLVWGGAVVAGLVAGCGSHRLETALELEVAAGSGASPQGGAEGSLGGNGGAGAPGGAGQGDAGGSAAGEPGALNVEPLITVADFGQSYTVGPLNAERFVVPGQPSFAEAWRATMNEPPSSPWIAQLVMPLNKPVQAGQLLHVSFWVSCEAKGPTGDCYTEYIFERDGEPWEKSVTFKVHAGQGWEQKSEYFSVVDSYAAGASHMVFRLGYESQVIAIGGLELEAIGSP